METVWYLEAFVEDVLGLLLGAVLIPVVGDNGLAEVAGEAGSYPLVLEVGAVEVDGGQVLLSVVDSLRCRESIQRRRFGGSRG